MTKYFAFNTLAGASRSSTLVVDGDTGAGRFDATYNANCIKVPTGGDYFEIGQPFADGSASIAGTFWFRFDTYQTNGFSSGNTLALWLNAGANAYRIQNTAGSTVQMQYWNSGTSAWVNWGASFALGASTLYTIAVKLVVNTSFEIYVGGALVANSAVVPTNGAAAFTVIRCAGVGNSGIGYFSQLMGADYDIRDTHYTAKLANAEGTYTNGTGVYTDINETVLDESTAIALPAVGNKHTFTKSAIASIPAGLQIGAMVCNARGRVSGGVVADGKFLIRSGATDALSGAKAFTSGYSPRMHIVDNDPNTGTRFTLANFNAAEFGAQAA